MFKVGQFTDHSARPLSLDDLYSQLTNQGSQDPLNKHHSKSQHFVVCTAYGRGEKHFHNDNQSNDNHSHDVNNASINSAFEDLLNFDASDSLSNPVNEALCVLDEVDFVFDDETRTCPNKTSNKKKQTQPTATHSTSNSQHHLSTSLPYRSINVATQQASIPHNYTIPSYRQPPTQHNTIISPNRQSSSQHSSSVLPNRWTSNPHNSTIPSYRQSATSYSSKPASKRHASKPHKCNTPPHLGTSTTDLSPRRTRYRNESTGLKPRSQSHSDVHRDSLINGNKLQVTSLSQRDLYPLRRPLSKPTVTEALSRCDFLKPPVITPPTSAEDDCVDPSKLLNPEFLWSAVKIETNVDGFWSQRTRSCQHDRKEFFFSGDNSMWVNYASKEEKTPHIDESWNEYTHKPRSPQNILRVHDKNTPAYLLSVSSKQSAQLNKSLPEYKDPQNLADLYNNKLFKKQVGVSLSNNTEGSANPDCKDASYKNDPHVTPIDTHKRVVPAVSNTTTIEAPVVGLQNKEATQNLNISSPSSVSSASSHPATPGVQPPTTSPPLMSSDLPSHAPQTISHIHSPPVSDLPLSSSTLETHNFTPKSFYFKSRSCEKGELSQTEAHSGTSINGMECGKGQAPSTSSTSHTINSILLTSPLSKPNTSPAMVDSLQDLLDSLENYNTVESLGKPAAVSTPSYQVINTSFVQYKATPVSGDVSVGKAHAPNTFQVPTDVHVDAERRVTFVADLHAPHSSITPKKAERTIHAANKPTHSNNDKSQLARTLSLPAPTTPKSGRHQKKSWVGVVSTDSTTTSSLDISEEFTNATDYLIEPSGKSGDPVTPDISLDSEDVKAAISAGNDHLSLDAQLSVLENIQTDGKGHFHDIPSTSGSPGGVTVNTLTQQA